MSNKDIVVGAMLGLATAMPSRHNPLDGELDKRPNCPVNKSGCYFYEKGKCLNRGECDRRDLSVQPGTRITVGDKTGVITDLHGGTMKIKYDRAEPQITLEVKKKSARNGKGMI